MTGSAAAEERWSAPSMDVVKLLEELDRLAVQTPRKLVGRLTYGLDIDEVAMQIAKVRASLPTEVKQISSMARQSERMVETAREDANMTVEGARREAERVMAEAQAEAARLVEQARLTQEKMLAENEILKLAKAQADEVRSAAEREALNLRRGAEGYAQDVLNQLEMVIGKVMTGIERGKAELESREERAHARERVLVR